MYCETKLKEYIPIQTKWNTSECKKTKLCVLVGNIIFFETVDQTFSILL